MSNHLNGYFGWLNSFRKRRKAERNSSASPVSETKSEPLSESSVPSSSRLVVQPPTKSTESNEDRPPWIEWKLGAEDNFLAELHNWNLAHKDQRLPDILKKIDKALDSAPSIVGLIPNSPFPAQSLVTALVSLIQLGIKIPGAKQDVYQFVNQLVVDITYLADIFDDSGSPDGRLLNKAWQDLEGIRDLVNDTCKWAHDKLNTMLLHAPSVETEIQELKDKLNHSRNSFMQISIIRALGALDTAIDGIEDLRLHNQITERRNYIKEILGSRVVPQAKYEEQQKLQCHEDTRDEILTEIDLWTRTPSRSEHCWWILGKPGVGKSAIGITAAKCLKDRIRITANSSGVDKVAQTTAEHGLKEKANLCAQFFVNYTLAPTTEPNHIFPTLAMQLASASPLAALLIYHALTKTPTIAETFSEAHAKALFVEPLCAIARYEPDMVVVVIDGVDELSNTNSAVLYDFTSVLCTVVSDLPENVKFLVLSRPEHSIVAKIAPTIKQSDLATEESKSDVNRFLRAELSKLARIYDWSDWPTEEQVTLLCRNAVGHLGWTTTAIRWIATQVDEGGRARCNDAINEVGQLGMGNLDKLYSHILHRLLPQELGPSRDRYLKGFQAVMGCLVALQEPLNVGAISALLSLENFDVLHFTRRISSLVVEGTEPVTNSTVPQMHKSVVDFLTRDRTSEIFHINESDHHHLLAVACFRIMFNPKELHFNMGGIITSHKLNQYPPAAICLSDHVVYACQSFVHHCLLHHEEILVQDVERFMKTCFLSWLEVLSLQRQIDRAKSILEFLQQKIKDKDAQLARFIADAIKFVKGFKPLISASAAHIYISALPFAPSSSLVAKHYLPQYPHTLCVKEAAWSPDDMVYSAALSLNGERIVANRKNHPLQVFDTKTGSVMFSSLLKVDDRDGHSKVAVSPDGNLIAAGSGQLWNAETGKEQKPGFILEAGKAVAFSPDSSHLAIGGSELHVWDLTSGEISSSPFKGHEGDIGSLIYSPDGTEIVSGSGYCICIWDSSTGTITSTFRLPGPIFSISYSPDGTQIAVSVFDGGDVRLWRPSTGNSHALEGVSDVVTSLAFSPNGKFLVSGCEDGAIQIWDLSTCQSIANLVGHSHWVSSVAFFPDGKQIMSASWDSTIRIWHIESLLEGKRGDIDEWRAGEEEHSRQIWILGSKRERLFHPARRPFRHPRNTLIIGKCLEIDFSHFVHGTDWVRCREPLNDRHRKFIGHTIMTSQVD